MPAYNEEAGIAHTVESTAPVLDRLFDDYELIVIDDGSTDGTLAVLQGLAPRFPRLRVLSYSPNRGYAEALRRGFAASARPFVFFTDADLQFDPEELPLLFDALDGADLAVGFRKDRRDPWPRKVYSRVYNGLQRVLLGIRATDINCAFKLFRREFITDIPLTAESFVINAEIFLRAKQRGARVAEVGVTHRERARGTSTVRPSIVFRTLREMARLRMASLPPAPR
jgi:dolichol-phosphate mannosyltransferase